MKISKLATLSLVLAAGIFLRSDRALAAVRTWDGSAGDRKFSTAANWSDDAVPVDGDSVIFPYSAALTTDGQSIDNDIVNLSLVSLKVSGESPSNCSNSYGFYKFIGNTLTITGNIDISETEGYCWNGVTLALNLIFSGSGVTLKTPDDTGDGSYLTIGDYQSQITLTIGATNISVEGEKEPQIPANISGSGTINGGNTGLYLSGDNSGFTGDISLATGTLGIEKPNSLGAGSSPVVLGEGTTLLIYMYSGDMTISRPLTLSGAGQANVSGGVKIWYGVTQGCEPAYTTTLSGTITLQGNVTYKSSCPARLIIPNLVTNGHTFSSAENNIGIVVLSGQEIEPTYKEVVIDDSKPNDPLLVTGYIINVLKGVRGDTYVNKLGVLKGNGSVGKLYVHNGGIVAPGLSPGCLSSGNLDLYGEYQFEAKGKVACSEHDQLKVTGTVKLTSTDTTPVSATINVSFIDKYNPAAGTSFVVIDNDGTDAVTGTFKDLAEGATFKGPNGAVLKISYKGGDGNDVVLTVVTAGTPNTGFGLLLNNPAATLAAAVVAGGAILVMSRRMKPAVKRVRR